MSLAFKQIKVYTKLVLVLAVAVAVGAVFLKNRSHEVRFWFFGAIDVEQKINVVWLIVCTAVVSVLCWWVLLAALSMVRDVREVRRERQLAERERAQRELAQELRQQEQRIDEKVKKAIGRDEDDDA